MATVQTDSVASSTPNTGDAKLHMESARVAAQSAREHLRDAGSHFKEGTTEAGESIQEAYRDAKVAASEAGQAASAKSADYVEKVSGLIRERPLVAFGTAFALGWLVARVTRRH